MEDMNNLQKTIKQCEEFGFNEQITREILWNTAYGIGRSRWYWGPRWVTALRGYINTKLYERKARRARPMVTCDCPKCTGDRRPSGVPNYWGDKCQCKNNEADNYGRYEV